MAITRALGARITGSNPVAPTRFMMIFPFLIPIGPPRPQPLPPPPEDELLKKERLDLMMLIPKLNYEAYSFLIKAMGEEINSVRYRGFMATYRGYKNQKELMEKRLKEVEARLAQWQSTILTRWGSQVRALHRAPDL